MGGGGKIPYPKHVWSPSGGWYSQPKNWRANTIVFGGLMAGVVGLAWMISGEREHRHKMPEKGRFFPSRFWSKQYKDEQKALNS